MEKILTDIKDLNEEYLMNILMDKDESIRSFNTREKKRLWQNDSKTFHIQIIFSNNISKYLFLKLSKTINVESLFYKYLGNTLEIIPHMYNTEIDFEEKKCQLFLEDLSKTHSEVNSWPLPPSRKNVCKIIETISIFHAYFWNKNDFLNREEILFNDKKRSNYYKKIRIVIETFCKNFSEHFPKNEIEIIEKVLIKHREAFELRLSINKSLTYVHGDLHTNNILFPKNETDSLFLIDFQQVHRDLPTLDLANLTISHWGYSYSQVIETLKIYHECIKKQNIDYSYDILLTDFKISLYQNLINYIKLYSKGISPEVWYMPFRRTLDFLIHYMNDYEYTKNN